MTCAIFIQVAYYIRPQAKALMASLRSCPNAEVAFYTSMTAANARPAVDCLGGRGLGLYDRPYNVPDPDATETWTSVWRPAVDCGEKRDFSIKSCARLHF